MGFSCFKFLKTALFRLLKQGQFGFDWVLMFSLYRNKILNSFFHFKAHSMKNSLLTVTKRILLFFLLIFISAHSFSQSIWTSQMPKPLGFLVYDASFADANNGWAVGESGLFAKTTDGGLTW